jgi:hypothetical protein
MSVIINHIILSFIHTARRSCIPQARLIKATSIVANVGPKQTWRR